jgi:hypothetical protein
VCIVTCMVDLFSVRRRLVGARVTHCFIASPKS